MKPAARPLAFALLLIVTAKCAWLCDDAYISFRQADHLVSGLGLRWNPAERVQAFTNPLWVFVVALGRALTGEVFWTALALSLLLTAVLAGRIAYRTSSNETAAALALVALAASKSFVDYSTSGLENPLTHLLVALFFATAFAAPTGPSRTFRLHALASLVALNRLDALLVLLPSLLLDAHTLGVRRAARPALAGLSLLMAWEAFSLVYYGFPFPNTAYAKLGHGFPAGVVLSQGIAYLAASLASDPVTLPIVAVAASTALRDGDAPGRAAAAGAVAYVLYTVTIGGDFMSGRFLALPCLVAVLALAAAPPAWAMRRPGAALALLFAASAAAPSSSPLLSGPAYGLVPVSYEDTRGITDEREYYFLTSSLYAGATGTPMPAHPWALDGRRARRALAEAGTTEVRVLWNVGYFGYFAGPACHLVDPAGLADPLLARLRPRRDAAFRPGHLRRDLPEGYLETLRTGVNRLVDPGLHAYYDHLSRVTRGNLFDPERILDIWNLNTGRYDPLLAGQWRAP